MKIQIDKIKHFLVNYIGILFLFLIMRELFSNPIIGAIIANIVMMLVSYLKEKYDEIKPKPTGFSIMDLVFNLFGILCADLTILLILRG